MCAETELQEAMQGWMQTCEVGRADIDLNVDLRHHDVVTVRSSVDGREIQMRMQVAEEIHSLKTQMAFVGNTVEFSLPYSVRVLQKVKYFISKKLRDKELGEMAQSTSDWKTILCTREVDEDGNYTDVRGNWCTDELSARGLVALLEAAYRLIDDYKEYNESMKRKGAGDSALSADTTNRLHRRLNSVLNQAEDPASMSMMLELPDIIYEFGSPQNKAHIVNCVRSRARVDPDWTFSCTEKALRLIRKVEMEKALRSISRVDIEGFGESLG